MNIAISPLIEKGALRAVLARERPRLVAWAWGVNGVGSVTATTLAVLIASQAAASGQAQTPTTLKPPAPAQFVATYKVGASDVLGIKVFGEDELSNKYTVDTDGSITFPLIGRFQVGGKTTREIEEGLTKALVPDWLKRGQASARSRGLADRHDAIEPNHGAIGEADELVVPLHDLHPVCVGDVPGVRVQGRDCGLGLGDLVRGEVSRPWVRQGWCHRGDCAARCHRPRPRPVSGGTAIRVRRTGVPGGRRPRAPRPRPT